MDPAYLREMRLKRTADGYIGEIAYTLLIVVAATIFVISNKNAVCNIPAKGWLAGIMGIYLIDFITTMF